jgi:hypothetical protein
MTDRKTLLARLKDTEIPTEVRKLITARIGRNSAGKI